MSIQLLVCIVIRLWE